MSTLLEGFLDHLNDLLVVVRHGNVVDLACVRALHADLQTCRASRSRVHSAILVLRDLLLTARELHQRVVTRSLLLAAVGPLFHEQ